ncbi:nuclear exosome regulator NRDE2 [Drosophila biarmipes]|uniref:nuclear exosome regulator NRDE2 n=1 Tax=Drosophila biarmipes TaxID=125945 RepID=UPI0007E84B2D|nr:nuclear exosome regulator NRDE2 [Drosophila biarmipes]
MSLFPAYGGGQSSEAVSAKEPEEAAATTSADWRNNESYLTKPMSEGAAATLEPNPDTVTTSDESSSAEEEDKPVPEAEELPRAKPLEFDARDEFFVDKKSNSSLRSISTLSKPAQPLYKIRMSRLRDPHINPRYSATRSKLSSSAKSSRYTRKPLDFDALASEPTLRIQEQLIQTKALAQQQPQVLDHWLQLQRLINFNVYKANRLAVAEEELRTLETALEHHPSNERILRLYSDIANATYPASEVAARFEKMLEKNPFEYTLWTSLIMVTQGNMARCTVPAVLRIYETSMRRMQVGHTDEISRKFATVDTDRIMLKLFHNCVLFLRQSGNMNKMFALLRLTMELNFPGLTVDCLEACTANEKLLIEYEELVLHSGMPMPEIWTRVERLRQAYCYLPYPQLVPSAEDQVERGLDSQRCIYSDDVVPYAHALKSPENRLHLLLLIVQHTKMPLVRSSCLAAKLNPCIDEFGESEAIEMLFAGLADRHSYVMPSSRNVGFHAALINLAKEMSVTPSFMPHFMGHELYGATVSGLLLKCCEAFGAEESKRRVFLLLWLRFQRLLVVLNKLMGKLTKAHLKETRDRIRNQMRLPENRGVLRFYTELAMCEFEGLEQGDDDSRVFDIFRKIIAAESESGSQFTCPDLMHAYLVCAEMLIQRSRRDEAVQVLSCLSAGQHVGAGTTNGIKACLERGLELLKEEVKVLDTLPAEMPLEEYFLPNKLLILLRATCLLGMLDYRYSEVESTFDELLQDQLGPEAAHVSERRRFLREQVLEIRILQLQLPIPPPGEVEKVYLEKRRSNRQALGYVLLKQLVDRGLHEFPRNMMMLQTWAGFHTMMWHKQRARLIRTKAGIVSLLHLVIAANSRFANAGDEDPLLGAREPYIQAAVRNRLLSMFETFLATNQNRSEIEAEQYRVLRRNSIYWRLYLKCLSDTRTSFERSKHVLLTAIDECPWDKALLMEGGTVLPNELPFLQDLMTEKELRMYALPEELDILRN